ncbi:MAG: glycosyltransferase family 4 protein [Terriglobales bacterium]
MKKSAEVADPSFNLDGGEGDPCQKASRRNLRVLALFETATVSGPAKNFFQFCRSARKLTTGPVVDMSIVTFERSLRNNRNGDFVEVAQQLGLPLHCIPENFLFDALVLLHLRRLHADLSPDLIETHAVKSHALVRASGLWRKTPWIAFHHGYTNTSLRSPLYNSMDRWSLRGAARVITMNGAFQQQLMRRGLPVERLTVVHNAVAIPGHPAGRETLAQQRKKGELGISPDAKLILCVGRLSREKGHIHMVAALRQLRHVQPGREVYLIIMGEGPEKLRLTQAIQSSGLDKHVMFAGQLKDVAPYYEAADVVGIPSLSEGSPNVLLEAMAYGVPVVATSVGGIPEIVTHEKTAMLVPPRHPVAMAEAIEGLLSNPAMAANMARLAKEKVEKDYSPESRAKTLIDIYTAACRPVI